MNTLIYYVAIGETHREFCKLSLDSLYLSGYEGVTHIITDAPWTPRYAPAAKVYFSEVESTHIWGAKRYKAQFIMNLAGVADYDAVFFNDCDTIVTGNVAPMLARIADNPDNLFVTRTGNRRLMATRARHLFQESDQTTFAPVEMFDSSGVGFVPTPENLALIAAWDDSNQFQENTSQSRSDAFGLNHAILTTGRFSDTVFLAECERMNGLPAPATIIRHYCNRQTQMMPLVFASEVERPYLDTREAA